MAQITRVANLGYCALIKESVAGTPLTPTTYVPLYKDTLNTDIGLEELSPIVGVRAKNYQAMMGLRKHEGTIEVQAEPNTAEYWFDMLLTQGAITGANPYTHPYTLGADSNSYTIDLLRGQVVHRYWGCKAISIENTFNKNEMRFNIDISGLGSFIVREIASVNTTTLTLKTTYDQAPNKGLVATDLIRIMKSDGTTTLDTTVSSVNADGITVVIANSAASFAAGDFIFLRTATPSLTLLPSFQWGNTQYCFATSASSALSAAQTNLESGSKWKITYSIDPKTGADRSGAFDPSALPRTLGEYMFTVKRFFDFPDDVDRWLSVANYACVARHFVYSGGNTYELRVTMNSMYSKSQKRPLDTGKIVYNEIEYDGVYNVSDGQLFDVKVFNAVSS